MVHAREIQLTRDFRLGEFVQNLDEMPPVWILDNLTRLANRLQVIRDLIQHPIQITSGYRTVAHNRSVGGSSNSYHLSGLAADVVVSGMSAKALQQFLTHWSGGMGQYDSFTHLDIRPYPARWSG